MEREVRYCTSADGTRIAYSVAGEGPPLLNCPGTWESFGDRPEEFLVYDAVWQARTSVVYDFRGNGLSQRDSASYALDRMVEDIEAVVDAAKLERFALLGTSLSSPVAIQYAATHPDQVSRLALLTVITDARETMPLASLQGLLGLIRTNWETGSQMLADLGNRSANPATAVRLAESYRRCTSAEAVAQMLTDLYETIHLGDVLKDLTMPTLIMHRRGFEIFPFSAAQQAAGMIPDARLVALPGSGPPSLGEDAVENLRILSAFLDEDD